MAKTRNRAKQDIVIAELAKGATQIEAAAKAGITRHAVTEWNAEDPDYRQRLEAAREKARAKYTQLLERAAERAAELLESGDGKTAIGALKVINERGLGPANAPTVQVNNAVQINLGALKAEVDTMTVDELAEIYGCDE